MFEQDSDGQTRLLNGEKWSPPWQQFTIADSEQNINRVITNVYVAELRWLLLPSLSLPDLLPNCALNIFIKYLHLRVNLNVKKFTIGKDSIGWSWWQLKVKLLNREKKSKWSSKNKGGVLTRPLRLGASVHLHGVAWEIHLWPRRSVLAQFFMQIRARCCAACTTHFH